jgi:hypothetical protein
MRVPFIQKVTANTSRVAHTQLRLHPTVFIMIHTGNRTTLVQQLAVVKHAATMPNDGGRGSQELDITQNCQG